jgi:hypothetical protein
MPHPILTTQTEQCCFTMLLAQNKVVHMKLSLCLRFYLRGNLEGYTVGTTMGFPNEIME